MDKKICTKCKIEKPVSLFEKRKDRPCGYRSDCKACKGAQQKARAQTPEGKAIQKAKDARHYSKEGLEKQRAASRRSYEKKLKKPGYIEQRDRYLEDYRTRNPAKFREYRANYRARKARATPCWADKQAISKIYTLAEEQRKLTGEDVHVDHMVPLNAELVCGLHVAANLTIVVGDYNNRKNNRTWPGMP